MTGNESLQLHKISFAQQLEVTVPSTGLCFPIPESEWQYLKNKINRIQQPKFLFQTIGSAALGVTGSAFVAAVTLPNTLVIAGVPGTLICWGLTIVFLFGGVLSLFFARNQKQLILLTREDVLEEMRRIENRFRTEDGQHSMESSGSLTIHAARYGAADHWIDLVDKLRGMIRDGKLRVLVGNDIGGDPIKGVRKELTVEYSYLGKKQVRKAREKENLELP